MYTVVVCYSESDDILKCNLKNVWKNSILLNEHVKLAVTYEDEVCDTSRIPRVSNSHYLRALYYTFSTFLFL